MDQFRIGRDRQRLSRLHAIAFIDFHFDQKTGDVAFDGKLALGLNGAGGIKRLNDRTFDRVGDGDKRAGEVNDEKNAGDDDRDQQRRAQHPFR